MSEYLNDEQILEKIKSIKVRELVRERFQQKDKQLSFNNARLQEAANIIGHNTISECMMYE
jgi:ribosomal protein L29